MKCNYNVLLSPHKTRVYIVQVLLESLQREGEREREFLFACFLIYIKCSPVKTCLNPLTT